MKISTAYSQLKTLNINLREPSSLLFTLLLYLAKIYSMKKILLLATALFCVLVFAQQSKFEGNYSTKSLKEIHKTVPQQDKQEYYKQYFKAKVFEEMKETFTYKNHPDIILKKFTDTVFAFYDGGDILINENVVFTPSKTWDEHKDSYQKFMEKDPEESAKYLSNTLRFENEKEKAKYFEELKNITIQQQKELKRTPEELRKEYDELVANEKESFENDPATSIGHSRIIAKLDEIIISQKESEDLEILLQSNLSPQIGLAWYFPSVSAEPGESSIYETVPGEILTFVTETGVAEGRNFMSYRILGDHITPLHIYPNDTNFDKKVSKYAKKGWRTEPRAFYDIKKDKTGDYVISTMLYAEEDGACCPTFSFEYKTKDFKNFTPLRIARNDNEKLVWKDIK